MSLEKKELSTNSCRYWLHTLIFFAIMICVSHIQPPPPLTPLGMKVIGIFLGVLYAWIFIDIIWPSIAGLLAMGILGVMKPVELLNKSFGDPIVVMMLFIFIFCAAISHYGLSRFIALWFISRRFVQGRPWIFTYTFLAAVMLLGGLTSGTPAVLIGWSLFYGVCELCGYKKGDGYPTMMIFGVVFAAQFGMSIIPFKSVPLAIIGAYEKISHTSIDYAAYMIMALVGGFVLLGAFILVGRFLFRPDMEKLRTLDISRLAADSSLTLDKVQKLALFFLFALLGLMLAPSFLPSDFFLTRCIKSIGYTGICMLIVMCMRCIRIDGKSMLPVKTMIDKGVSWEIIFLLAFVFPISGPMSDPASGITSFFMLLLDPLFGQNSQVLFAVTLGLFAACLTQFINNSALGAALMPLIYSYCTANNFPPETSVILVVMGVHLAFLTPAASSTAATLHGNDWCDARSIWKMAPTMIALSYLLLALLMLTLGRVVL